MVKIENMVEVECPVLNSEGLGVGLKHNEIGRYKVQIFLNDLPAGLGESEKNSRVRREEYDTKIICPRYNLTIPGQTCCTNMKSCLYDKLTITEN
ncbi:hypothetical protein HOD29_02210 [archaeon]|jgi:hypothetical protein|nr:hypothetical protein [archaeon]